MESSKSAKASRLMKFFRGEQGLPLSLDLWQMNILQVHMKLCTNHMQLLHPLAETHSWMSKSINVIVQHGEEDATCESSSVLQLFHALSHLQFAEALHCRPFLFVLDIHIKCLQPMFMLLKPQAAVGQFALSHQHQVPVSGDATIHGQPWLWVDKRVTNLFGVVHPIRVPCDASQM